jgi:hypothetical protein
MKGITSSSRVMMSLIHNDKNYNKMPPLLYSLPECEATVGKLSNEEKVY